MSATNARRDRRRQSIDRRSRIGHDVRVHDAIEIVFETHAHSEDNANRIATGWNHGRLSAIGRQQAQTLGARRRTDGIAAVFTSDLDRAVETVTVAFHGSGIPVLHDWRLRECDYGEQNGTPAEVVHAQRPDHLDKPYPGGETWREAVGRVGRFLDDLPLRWSGSRVLVIGHIATHWGLDHFINRERLEDLVASQFVWQEGWEYRLPIRT